MGISSLPSIMGVARRKTVPFDEAGRGRLPGIRAENGCSRHGVDASAGLRKPPDRGT